MHTLNFHISAIPLSLRTHAESLFAIYQNYFRYYQTSTIPCPQSPQLLRLKLIAELPEQSSCLPPSAKLLSQIGELEFWEAERRGHTQYFLRTNVTLFRIEPMRGKIVGLIAKDALSFPNLLANTYTFTAILLLLRWHARYHLHTAAIISPRENLYLICGAQRAGKTTLTTALGVSGWQAISDDGVLVQADENGSARVQAFKRDFHIAAELLQKWEALRSTSSLHNYFDRACINGLELFGAKDLANEFFTKVDYVIFPQIADSPQSSLAPLAPSEALHRLIGQSMFFPLWTEHTRQQMSWLTQLVKSAKFFQLQAGTDIWENPLRAAKILHG